MFLDSRDDDCIADPTIQYTIASQILDDIISDETTLDHEFADVVYPDDYLFFYQTQTGKFSKTAGAAGTHLGTSEVRFLMIHLDKDLVRAFVARPVDFLILLPYGGMQAPRERYMPRAYHRSIHVDFLLMRVAYSGEISS